MITGKVPPQAIEAEKAVLGTLLLNGSEFDSIKSILSTESFYSPTHQIIYKVIEEMATAHKPIDLITVSTQLKDSGEVEKIGGYGYLSELTLQIATAFHLVSHARIVAEKHYLRQVIKQCAELTEIAFNCSDVEVMSGAIKELTNSLDDVFTVADTGSHIQQVLSSTVLQIEADCKANQEGLTAGIPTGLKRLDNVFSGWRGGNMIVLAARPGIGKTSLALHFAVEAAIAGYWVNIFSYEMLKEDLAKILIARESGVYRTDIRDGTLKNQDWEKIDHAIGRLEKLPIIFRDASGLSVVQAENIIKRNRKNGRCDFVIVDYLQLIKSGQKKANRELEVSEMSRTLKTVALAENIPVMALSQLNRIADSEKPKVSHLRESGAIEQDADIICLLSRDPDNEKAIIFDTAKNRRGRMGEINIFPNDQMTTFSDSPLPTLPY